MVSNSTADELYPFFGFNEIKMVLMAEFPFFIIRYYQVKNRKSVDISFAAIVVMMFKFFFYFFGKRGIIRKLIVFFRKISLQFL